MSSVAMREGLKGKTLKIIYCVVNLVLAFATISPSFSARGLWWSAVVLAVAFARVVMGDNKRPVCSYLCWFFLMQCLVYMGVHWGALVDALDPDALVGLADLMKNNDVAFTLAFIGAITVLIGLCSKKYNVTWLFGSGCCLLGLGLLLPLWSVGVPLVSIAYAENGGAVIAMYTLLALCWTACMYVVTHVWPSSRGECIVFTVILFGMALFVNVYCNTYVHSIGGDLKQFLLSLPNDLFSWPHVVLALVVLIVLSALPVEYRHVASDVDRSFLLLCANFLLAIRLLMSFYFTYSWILFLFFGALALRSLKNEADNRETFGMACSKFLGIEILTFALLTFLLCFALLANALFTAVFAILFYSGRDKIKGEPSSSRWWIGVISFFVAEAFAYMMTWNNSVEGYIMLGLVWVPAVAVVLIINRKHPVGIASNNKWHKTITVCVAVLCIALCIVSPFSPANVKATTQENQVQIAVETLGEDNGAVAKYYWTNSLRNRMTDEQGLEGPTINTPIVSDVLTVVAVDSKGIESTRRFFYAPWMHKFMQDENEVPTQNTEVSEAAER